MHSIFIFIEHFVKRLKGNGNVRVTWIYIAHSHETSKALRHGLHSFT